MLVKLVTPNSNELNPYNWVFDVFGVTLMLAAEAYMVSLMYPSKM